MISGRVPRIIAMVMSDLASYGDLDNLLCAFFVSFVLSVVNICCADNLNMEIKEFVFRILNVNRLSEYYPSLQALGSSL